LNDKNVAHGPLLSVAYQRIVLDTKCHCISLDDQRSVSQSQLSAWIASGVLVGTFSVSSNVSAVCCHTRLMFWLAPLFARQGDPDQPA
jgi:hypothetical protein